MLFAVVNVGWLQVSGVPRNFILGEGVSTNSAEDRGQREQGSGGGSPYSGVPLNSQMNETRNLIRLLLMYFPRNREFGSASSKLRNWAGGGFEPANPPRYATVASYGETVLLSLGVWV
jgi:hypothetical protein